MTRLPISFDQWTHADKQHLLGAVDAARLASSLPSLDPREAVVTARIWGEVLAAANVPPSALRKCLIYALATREKSYPVVVSEICAAWRQMQRNERPAKVPGCECSGSGYVFYRNGQKLEPPEDCICQTKPKQ